MDELRERGFEVGLHGLHHDGKTFRSASEFLGQAEGINRHLQQFKALGFRAPLTHRNPGWMQALDMDYDLSFFDTDPYEPVAGGTMSLWPFTVGRFLELPYTLVQDHTLTEVLKETTPRIWLEKVDFIRRYSGMALVITHPDYLRNPTSWRMYADFLRVMRNRADFWHALPRDLAGWWRARLTAPSVDRLPGGVARVIALREAPELRQSVVSRAG
jgi:peptidoglycan/xylan/chitin deacetylase (PgdA/CDA1 family)